MHSQFSTPSPAPLIKKLITFLCSFSISCQLLEPLANWTGFSLLDLFAASVSGLSHFYLWQPLSALFILSPSIGGLSFNFLFDLFLQVAFLWIFAPQVLDFLGQKKFLLFYLGIGVLTNILSLSLLSFLGTDRYLYGPHPSSYALLMLWTLLFPQAELFLFFIFPLKASSLIIGSIGLNFLIHLSHAQFFPIFRDLIALTIAYLTATVYFKLPSPFFQLQRFSDWLQRFKPFLGKKGSAEIFDIQSGAPLNDDAQFLDAMLAKISKHGEEALSRSERARMQKISQEMQAKNSP